MASPMTSNAGAAFDQLLQMAQHRRTGAAAQFAIREDRRDPVVRELWQDRDAQSLGELEREPHGEGVVHDGVEHIGRGRLQFPQLPAAYPDPPQIHDRVQIEADPLARRQLRGSDRIVTDLLRAVPPRAPQHPRESRREDPHDPPRIRDRRDPPAHRHDLAELSTWQLRPGILRDAIHRVRAVQARQSLAGRGLVADPHPAAHEKDLRTGQVRVRSG